MAYRKNSTQHYTFAEMLSHAIEVKKHFPSAKISYKCNKLVIDLILKPTDMSINYKVRLVAKQGCQTVGVFVKDPQVYPYEKGKKVPHLYSDGALCLYYPKHQEWNYRDSWAETLIPWAALWLFYYEIWRETGSWLGGGIHTEKT